MKKLVSALLLAVLCISLCAPVMAETRTAAQWATLFETMDVHEEGYGRLFAEFIKWCKDNGVNPLSVVVQISSATAAAHPPQ